MIYTNNYSLLSRPLVFTEVEAKRKNVQIVNVSVIDFVSHTNRNSVLITEWFGSEKKKLQKQPQKYIKTYLWKYSTPSCKV